MTGVVDSHVHLLPERLGTAIRGFFAAAGMDTGRFAYPLDNVAVCESLLADGITEAWSLPYARRPGTAEALNAATAAVAADCSARTGLRVVPGATVHPGDDDPAAVLRRAVADHGARVLKLHCSVGDYTPDDGRLDPVWETVSVLRLPVVVHAGHAVSGHTDGHELEPIGTVARRWPEARIVIAHCGHRAAARALELLGEHPSLHADLTPVVSELVDLPVEAARAVADRLLFGSDAPNTTFRAGQVLSSMTARGLDMAAMADAATGVAARLRDAVAT